MIACGDAVTDPGYLVTPWGRMRRFPKVHANNEYLINAMRREAQNFPYWIGEVKWGEFSGSRWLMGNTELSRGSNTAESAETNLRVLRDGNENTSALAR